MSITQNKKGMLIKTSLKLTLLFFVALLALVWLINTPPFDEDLALELSYLKNQNVEPKVEGNIFYFFYGIAAVENKDPIAAGKQLIERYRVNRDVSGNDDLTTADFEEILGGAELDKAWLDAFPQCTGRLEDGCPQKYLSIYSAETSLNPRLEFMLTRYQELLKLDFYQPIEDLTFATPLPSYRLPLRLGQIHLIRAIAKGDSRYFYQKAVEEIKFWKKILRDSDTLISKMVAAAALHNAIQNISFALDSMTWDKSTLTDLKETFASLSAEEKNVNRVLLNELKVAHKYFKKEQGDLHELLNFGESFITNFLQPNATTNLIYKYYIEPINQLNKASAQTIYQHYLNHQENVKSEDSLYNNANLSPWSLSALYNPGGKFIYSDAFGFQRDYVYRIFDLDGLLSLARLKAQIKIAQLSTANLNIDEFVKGAEERNPYTGEAFEYSAEEKTLSLQCLEATTYCKLTL